MSLKLFFSNLAPSFNFKLVCLVIEILIWRRCLYLRRLRKSREQSREHTTTRDETISRERKNSRRLFLPTPFVFWVKSQILTALQLQLLLKNRTQRFRLTWRTVKFCELRRLPEYPISWSPCPRSSLLLKNPSRLRCVKKLCSSICVWTWMIFIPTCINLSTLCRGVASWNFVLWRCLIINVIISYDLRELRKRKRLQSLQLKSDVEGFVRERDL